MTKKYEQFMMQCLELARIALKNGDPPVGSVIVHNDLIIGKGIESGRSTGDITNHAEILAVRDAISSGNQSFLGESKLYTTHEPCIMCSYLIRHHKIPQIIYGLAVDSVGGHTSRFDVLNTTDVEKWGNKPEVLGGICEEQCSSLMEEYANSHNG